MANSYPEPYRSAPIDSLVDPSTCYNRECVSYTAWKVREATGKWVKRTGDMNARNWIYRLPENGYRRVAAPKAGGKYIGVITSGPYGHVVWWEGGNKISEYNWLYYGGYSERTVNLAQFAWFEIVAPKAKSVKTTRIVVGKRTALSGTAKVTNYNGVNVRSSPSTGAKIVATYKRGGIFLYDSYIITNGYIWLSYIAYSGNRVYVAEGRNDGNPNNTYLTGGLSSHFGGK